MFARRSATRWGCLAYHLTLLLLLPQLPLLKTGNCQAGQLLLPLLLLLLGMLPPSCKAARGVDKGTVHSWASAAAPRERKAEYKLQHRRMLPS
jgi:hypothetical protein